MGREEDARELNRRESRKQETRQSSGVDPRIAGETGDALGPDLTKKEITTTFGIVVNLSCVGTEEYHKEVHSKATMRGFGAGKIVEIPYGDASVTKMFWRYCFQCSVEECGKKTWLLVAIE